jgi:phenylpropionate dioxygenase-like ring-hydroxylating dioxygenase large terminal subunit
VTPAPNGHFDYLRQWYPVYPLEDLAPNRPTGFELLGRRYVVWKPSGGREFRIFLDVCPHRLAPLSEGRLDPDSGHLMCSYHGWQFDGEGLCRRIPQADPPTPSARQAQHLCATALPSREEQDLLWLWPDPASAEQAAGTPLPLTRRTREPGDPPMAAASDGGKAAAQTDARPDGASDAAEPFIWSSVVRDLPYDWRTLVENVADPSHVPFAHHGIQGRRDKAGPIRFEMLREDAGGFEAQAGSRNFALFTRVSFEPPCRLEYCFDFPGGKRMGLLSYCLPVGPGRSRIVAQFPRNFSHRLGRLLPRWWDHIVNRNAVLDGDLVLLHEQERELARRRASEPDHSWKTAYRLPASADRLVIAFHRWLDQQGGPPWSQLLPADELGAEGPGASIPSEQLLDRYHQHTVHCASCRGALKTIQRLQIGGVVVFTLTLAATALLPDRQRVSIGLPLATLGLVALGVAAGLRFALEPRFRYRPYDHSRR